VCLHAISVDTNLKKNGRHGGNNNPGWDHDDEVNKKTIFHKECIHGIMVYACDQCDLDA
jgi:hypothetical protein